MSKRNSIDWEITDEYGEYRKTIKVVYYYDKAVCPQCKGTGVLPYDNRVPVDFSAHFDRPAEPEPLEQECFMCRGGCFVEKIDYNSMTTKQIKIYRDYQNCMKKMDEKYEDYLSDAKSDALESEHRRQLEQEEEVE